MDYKKNNGSYFYFKTEEELDKMFSSDTYRQWDGEGYYIDHHDHYGLRVIPLDLHLDRMQTEIRELQQWVTWYEKIKNEKQNGE